MCKFKAGDLVKAISNAGSQHFTVGKNYVVVHAENPTGRPLDTMIRCIGDDGQPHGQFAERWALVTGAHMAPIDWTKPIQSNETVPRRAHYIGKNSVGNSVVEVDDVHGKWFYLVNADGSPTETHKFGIVNTPPKPVWPRKRFFLCWEKAGVPRISGPTCERASCEQQIERLKKSSLAALYSNFHIQEVNFGQ
jgi:hypothetical protein